MCLPSKLDGHTPVNRSGLNDVVGLVVGAAKTALIECQTGTFRELHRCLVGTTHEATGGGEGYSATVVGETLKHIWGDSIVGMVVRDGNDGDMVMFERLLDELDEDGTGAARAAEALASVGEPVDNDDADVPAAPVDTCASAASASRPAAPGHPGGSGRRCRGSGLPPGPGPPEG